MRRVVVTGYGINSPIGNSKEKIIESFNQNLSGIKFIQDWDQVPDFKTRLAGIVEIDDFKHIPRKYRRSMGRVAMLACDSVQAAIDMADIDQELLSSQKAGLAFGSTMGSLENLHEYYSELISKGMGSQRSTSFLKVMSHTCAANVAQMFGIKGRVIASCTACVASSQSIGYGFEAIKYGMSDLMLCGGAEEMHYTSPGVFETLYATSTSFNDTPEQASRPFDDKRDGLVTAEGAATVVLEEYDHAVARGAEILGEVLGFATNCDGEHLTSPSSPQMAEVMKSVLTNAELKSEDIDYINAHATATDKGDIAESIAIEQVFGQTVPVSSTKGYTGHMLGGCGAAEFIFSLFAIQDNFLPANKNLDVVDDRCATLNYIQETKSATVNRVMSNNFAFGGINTSLILGSI